MRAAATLAALAAAFLLGTTAGPSIQGQPTVGHAFTSVTGCPFLDGAATCPYSHPGTLNGAAACPFLRKHATGKPLPACPYEKGRPTRRDPIRAGKSV